MKKLILIFSLWLMLPGAVALAFPPSMPSVAGSGAMATDTIWDAAGDLAVGTGANTGGRLAIGGAYYLLHSNGTTPAWTLTLGATGTRLTKGWFTDLEITNMPTIGGSAIDTVLASSVGDCTGGACLDGSSDGGTYIRLYDGNSHYTGFAAGDSSANLTFTFPTGYAAQNLTPMLMSTAGVLSAATYSFPAADCNEGEILKADGSGNFVCTATLGLTTFILPSTDADPATNAGTIKHDTSDTDASAGGIVEWYDGTNTRRVIDGAASAAANYTVVVKTEFIPVAYMTDGAAAPGALTTYGTTKYRDFVHDATKDVKFLWMTPLDLIGTTVKVRAITMVTSATAPADNEGVSWGISAAAVAGSASVDASRGTVVYSEDADLDNDCNAQYDACFFPYVEVTPAVTVAAGTLMAFTVNRKHDDSDDDYGQSIGLLGVEIKYKARINLVDTW